MTARRLVLVRHGKAETAGGADADRVLTARGAADAGAVGRWLAGQGLVPSQVVVSPARRAVQTWQRAASELGPVPAPELDARVYANTVEHLLGVVREAPPEVDTLVVVGHNPSMAALVAALDDGQGDPAARRQVTDGFATSAVAVFLVGGDWAQVQPGSATLAAVVTARA